MHRLSNKEALALVALFLAGCAARPDRGSDAAPSVMPADRAAELNQEGLQFLQQGQWDRAFERFRAAIEADVGYAAAHNNLGTAYYRAERWYDAAWEFQYAIKLQPQSAEPYNNLGLVYDRIGRLDEAEKWYAEAVRLAPNEPIYAGNLASVRLRRGQSAASVHDLLLLVVERDRRENWVRWARQKLAALPTTP